jgi:hypothetical protein
VTLCDKYTKQLTLENVCWKHLVAIHVASLFLSLSLALSLYLCMDVYMNVIHICIYVMRDRGYVKSLILNPKP